MTGRVQQVSLRRWACVAGVMVVAQIVPGTATSRAEIVDRIVATIDGEPVTLVELESFAEQVRRRAGASGEAPPGTDQRALLDELVLERIIKKQIEAQGLAATDQQIDTYIRSIRERNDLTEAQLKQALEQQGLTWEQYREQVRSDIERANLINKEIRSKVNVSPEEVERYYKAHPGEHGGASGASVRVRLLSRLVPAGASSDEKAAVRAEAERIHGEAASGKDFAELARQHSQGPAADEGGDLGEIEPSQMQEEFATAAAGLKPGQVSPVVETTTGYHILKVEKRSEGKSGQPSAEATEAIREKLYREAMEERYDRWLKQDLRARHHVEIML